MKKRTMISLLVAVGLVIGGAVLVAVGVLLGGENLLSSQLTQRNCTVTDPFESVVIKTGDCSVTFAPLEDGQQPYVVLQEKEKISHSIKVQEGVLKIEMVDNRQWTDHISICFKSMEMTLYLPQKQYEDLHITTATGDIKLPEGFCANALTVRTNTGDIWCEASALELVYCVTDTGKVHVSKATPVTLELYTDTGDMALKDVEATEIHLQTDTGEVTAQDVNCQIITCESDTGDVTVDTLAVEDYLQVFTATGDVQIQKADVKRINIETDTGDVQVPASFKQKDCRIESDTGDIQFQ